MISKLNIAFKTAGGLRVLACAVLVVLIVFSSVGSTLEAQQGAEPLRKPPFEAIAACEGKKEGEPCTFNSPHGILNGDCMVGVENMFGCRPHRAPRTWPPAEPVSLNGKPWQYAGVFISCLAAAIISALLTWYGFFRYSILPLRRLRKVTQQLADGDLSARVGEGLVHQKNEVVELGRDVDRMAERIETLVGAHKRLIRDVSHELRSPLSRLNVALELARQSAGPALSAPFDRIERESNRLNELISQMLTLTRLENENGTIKMIPLDIAALVEEIARDVDFEAKSNGCSVVVTSESSPLILNGNREMLRQALENLLLNAIRYTAKGTSV
ncbi:MAG: HAMP domain-containing protein, partial [Nitrospirae bacterium]|nr:HAMP domain-containing protein [Nitrospirota bacterium]